MLKQLSRILERRFAQDSDTHRHVYELQECIEKLLKEKEHCLYGEIPRFTIRCVDTTVYIRGENKAHTQELSLARDEIQTIARELNPSWKRVLIL